MILSLISIGEFHTFSVAWTEVFLKDHLIVFQLSDLTLQSPKYMKQGCSLTQKEVNDFQIYVYNPVMFLHNLENCGVF